MAKHLRVCRDKHVPGPLPGRLKDLQAFIFHVTAEGRYAPEYWMQAALSFQASPADRLLALGTPKNRRSLSSRLLAGMRGYLLPRMKQ